MEPDKDVAGGLKTYKVSKGGKGLLESVQLEMVYG